MKINGLLFGQLKMKLYDMLEIINLSMKEEEKFLPVYKKFKSNFIKFNTYTSDCQNEKNVRILYSIILHIKTLRSYIVLFKYF